MNMVKIKMAAVQRGWRGRVADPDLVLHYNPPIRGPRLDDVLEARSSRLGGGGHDTSSTTTHVYQLENINTHINSSVVVAVIVVATRSGLLSGGNGAGGKTSLSSFRFSLKNTQISSKPSQKFRKRQICLKSPRF